MNEVNFSQSNPALRCWISHLLIGKYSENEKVIYTIFGKYKKARIIGTLMEKKEIIDNSYEALEGQTDTSRILFELDDGTGRLQAILWQVDPENYNHLNKGDIIDIVGRVNQYRSEIQIVPQIVKKITNPNAILLRDAEIIKEIQEGDLQEIPESSKDETELDEIPSEIDVDALFEKNSSVVEDSLKHKAYTLIEEFTSKGNGISFEKLLKKIGSTEEELRSVIRDLEMEAKIYQAEENIFQTYPDL